MIDSELVNGALSTTVDKALGSAKRVQGQLELFFSCQSRERRMTLTVRIANLGCAARVT
jgi:hypothetical protein